MNKTWNRYNSTRDIKY